MIRLHRYALAFLTPALPFVPTVAITVNIYLIFKLSILTLVRFTIWMTLGLIMYFYYGITHSTLENPSEEIELTVDQSAQRSDAGAAGSTSQQQQPQSAVWDRHGYENKMADDDWSQSQFTGSSWSNARHAPTGPAAAEGTSQAWGSATKASTKPASEGRDKRQSSAAPAQAGPVPGGFGIFVDETQFPTWDD